MKGLQWGDDFLVQKVFTLKQNTLKKRNLNSRRFEKRK
jgi:hypothetical protein